MEGATRGRGLPMLPEGLFGAGRDDRCTNVPTVVTEYLEYWRYLLVYCGYLPQ